MKKNIRKVLLFGLTSALLMTGCKGKEIVEIGGKQYIKDGEEFTAITSQTKTFLPGEHIVYYNVDIKNEIYFDNKNGWGNAKLDIPEAPDGYKYLDTITINDGTYGHSSNLIYVFVNEVPVEATSSYNAENNEIGFFEPGVPVKQLTLE